MAVVERLRLGEVEGEGVVELRRLPGRPELGVPVRVGRVVVRRDADPVAHDVVGVRVAAALVVRRHDVRAEPAHDLDQRDRRLVDVEGGEAALRQRRQRVALGQPGVDEPEPDLLDAEDAAGGVHLLPADLGDVRQHVGPVHVRVEDRAALAARCRSRPSPPRPRPRSAPSWPHPCWTRRRGGRARAAAAAVRHGRRRAGGPRSRPVIVPRRRRGVSRPSEPFGQRGMMAG